MASQCTRMWARDGRAILQLSIRHSVSSSIHSERGRGSTAPWPEVPGSTGQCKRIPDSRSFAGHWPEPGRSNRPGLQGPSDPAAGHGQGTALCKHSLQRVAACAPAVVGEAQPGNCPPCLIETGSSVQQPRRWSNRHANAAGAAGCHWSFVDPGSNSLPIDDAEQHTNTSIYTSCARCQDMNQSSRRPPHPGLRV
jgi:hypothetical protein